MGHVVDRETVVSILFAGIVSVGRADSHDTAWNRCPGLVAMSTGEFSLLGKTPEVVVLDCLVGRLYDGLSREAWLGWWEQSNSGIGCFQG